MWIHNQCSKHWKVCVFVTESRLTLLATRQANESGDEVLRQGIMTLFGKLADWEDGRVVSPKKASYWSLDTSFFYRTERERRWGNKVKRPFILQNRRGCVHLFFSHSQVGRVRLSPCELNKATLTFRQRGRVPWGRPLCMIIITKAMKSKG